MPNEKRTTRMYYTVLISMLVFFPSIVFSDIANVEYNYAQRRNILQEEERKFAGYNYDYTEDEKIVYNYLEYLKWEEFTRTRDYFPPARPIKLHISDVKNSKVYRVLKTFPKGGNLHLHHNHVVSKSKMLDIVMSSPVYDNFYVKATDPKKWRLNFFVNPPDGWLKVKGNSSYTKNILIKHATFLGVMDDRAINEPTNAGLRWAEMGSLFSVLGSSIINQANITQLYTEAMLQSALSENVQYLETKASAYNKLYNLNSDPAFSSKNGKQYIDNNDGELELNMTRDVLSKFIKDNPQFIGYKRIINSVRWKKASLVGQDAEKALRLHLKYPNLVAGFDLVSEEDKGYSLLFFLKDFAEIVSRNVSLPYFFHVAETNWPEDLLTSSKQEDPVATIENVYEAILLGAKRVGHGLGFLKHPYLMEILKTKKIAIEVNPVSNKMLGYVPDQRNHPGITYLRYGIPVVLGSDDPATFGYDEFTLDWYEVFMAWGLNLADLRQLALNSLTYSAMSAIEKTAALQKWTTAWNVFIDTTKREACSKLFTNTIPQVLSIFPKEGKLHNTTKVQVFGRNFQVATCKTIYCRFGKDVTKATFVYTHMISCFSPSQSPFASVPFSISFDGGLTYKSTNLTFSFIRGTGIIHEAIGK